MRLLLTAALAAAATIIPTAHASAQTDSRSVMWGVRAALDINIPGKWKTQYDKTDMYKTGLGGSVGVMCNIALPASFYIEPGLSAYYDTYGWDLAIPDEGINNVRDINPTVQKLGLRLPVVAGYDFSIARFPLTVFTGPEISYALYKHQDFHNLGNAYDDDRDYWDEAAKLNEHRNFDLAWKVGIGVPLEHVMVSVDAAFGLTDIIKASGVSCRENRVSIAATYYF